MGFWDKIRGELIDIIEWLDSSDDTMVYRFERQGNEIKNGAKLVVRETQVAVFINEGKIADVFGPGTYELATQNLPILSTLKGWKYGFNSPFKAEVYFLNTKNFTDQKWGTPSPIMLRDQDFGVVRIRAFGTYAIKIADPVKFIKEIVGTDDEFNTYEVTNQLKNMIITRFTDAIGESKIPVLDFASSYNELSDFVHKKIQPEFMEYGIELTKFLISNIGLPEAVEKAMDKRSSMGIIGNMNQYTQYQAAEAMENASKNPGGGMGDGLGMGMGFGMANQMMNNMNQQNQQHQQHNAPPPPPPPFQVYVAEAGQRLGPFDANQLKQMIASSKLTKQTLVWKQGMANWEPAENLPEILALFSSVPPPPPPPPPIS
ncbi:MAG: antifreeze protein [Bacteroidia bacterium]|nr:MAG: antifreeze protein [Bacteroidia bacterium]